MSVGAGVLAAGGGLAELVVVQAAGKALPGVTTGRAEFWRSPVQQCQGAVEAGLGGGTCVSQWVSIEAGTTLWDSLFPKSNAHSKP